MACRCGDDKIYKEEIVSSCNNELTDILVQGGSSAECCNKIPTKHKIQKIPRVLRQMDKFSPTCYEPQVISIGPYHRGKEELKPMEKFKIHLTREYVNNCKGTSANLMYNRIEGLTEEARQCYADEGGSTDRFDNKEFARMMFLDGCFLLQFIFCSINEKKEETFEKLKLKNHDIAFIQKDLFLLENQLPYMVLKELLKFTSFGEKQGLENIKEFIKLRNASPPRESCWEKVENFFANQIKCRRSRKGEAKEYKDDPAHLLELTRREIIDPNAFNEAINISEKDTNWYSYRSVQELKAAGIIFRPNRLRPNLLTDVRYEPIFVRAILRLPVMTIDDSTKSLLLNLVAYEMCPDGPNDYGVTSHLWLMDTLIDHPDDVKELRRKGIILNVLASDEQVADLFNEIADNLVPNLSAYANVRSKIEKHYKNRIKVWITEFLHTHFTTPWTVLAFIGAIVAIALSFIQSYYAVHPRQ